jgi:predicted DNA-binding WGR domain protein
MSWLAQYKDETILVQTSDDHNKFWIAAIDQKTYTASIRWGRIGIAGQKQEKTFSTPHNAARFVESKMAEKRRKGYYKIDKKTFDRISVEAAIVGTQNKCHNLQWVEITDDRSLTYVPVNNDRLQAPDCNPGLYVEVNTKKKYEGQDSFRFLFTFHQVYLLVYHLSGITAIPITKTNPIYELTGKVEEAIGRSLST